MNDKKFFLLAIALENATQAQLDLLIHDIKKKITKYTRAGKITDYEALTKEINKIIDDFYDLFVEHLQQSAQRVGKAKAEEELSKILPKLQSVGMYTEAIAFYQQLRNYEQSVAKRFMTSTWSGVNLPFRIKTIKAGSQKTVQNIIYNAFKNGMSAKELALKLEQYINPLPGKPRVEPYKEYRQRYGRPKSFTPKGVPEGSVQYNAMRIARTEMSRLYRQATVEFYKDKWWNKGFKWVLSNSHPKPDICDEYAAVDLYDAADIPLAHPHCMCDVIAVIMTKQEMRDYRNANQKSADREEVAV